MPGLDDLIGSLQQAQGGKGSQGGTGLEDILGGMLGGGGSAPGGGGGLGDILGSVLGGAGGSGGGGLGDILGGVLGGGGTQGSQSSGSAGAGLGGLMAVVGPLLASLLANGGLQKILGGMKSSGLSAQADSWVGTGANQAIDADQVRAALDDDQIAQVAQSLGVDDQQASEVLAQVLPGLVNSVTPEGQEPSDGDLDRLVETLNGFGS
jgi:uncharacterized protein YidB (DUF937 family)